MFLVHSSVFLCLKQHAIHDVFKQTIETFLSHPNFISEVVQKLAGARVSW